MRCGIVLVSPLATGAARPALRWSAGPDRMAQFPIMELTNAIILPLAPVESEDAAPLCPNLLRLDQLIVRSETFLESGVRRWCQRI